MAPPAKKLNLSEEGSPYDMMDDFFLIDSSDSDDDEIQITGSFHTATQTNGSGNNLSNVASGQSSTPLSSPSRAQKRKSSSNSGSGPAMTVSSPPTGSSAGSSGSSASSSSSQTVVQAVGVVQPAVPGLPGNLPNPPAFPVPTSLAPSAPMTRQFARRSAPFATQLRMPAPPAASLSGSAAVTGPFNGQSGASMSAVSTIPAASFLQQFASASTALFASKAPGDMWSGSPFIQKTGKPVPPKLIKKFEKHLAKGTNMDMSADSSDESDEEIPPPKVNPTAKVTKHHMIKYQSPTTTVWDPFAAPEWDKQTPNPICIKRMHKDIAAMLSEEKESKIYVDYKEADVTKFTTLMVGPKDTPYEGGFFEFGVRVGPMFPMEPPKVKLLTTDGGRVRFGPNLYNCGKVCLSILGTWSGPQWTPALTLTATMQSVQSLMSEGAMRNEPGYERMSREDKSVLEYDIRVRQDTIRVAVCDNVERALDEKSPLCDKFRKAILDQFIEYFDGYVKSCETYKDHVPSAGSSRFLDYMAPMHLPGMGNATAKSASTRWVDLKTRLMDLRVKVDAAIEKQKNGY